MSFADFVNDGAAKVGNWWDGKMGTTKSGGDTSDAQGALADAKNDYSNLSAPSLARVTPGQVTPGSAATQQSSATMQGPTAYNDIAVNPAYNQAQSAQMAALSNLAANGGRNAASDANLAQIQQNENANAAGQRGAIMQGMAARGMGSSGASELAQLSAAQGSQNNQSMQDAQVRGQQANTALQAGQGAAQIGAGMHAQDYGEQAQRAAASDAIGRFNAGTTTQNSQFNAGQGNEQSRFNTGLDAQSQQFNAGLGMQGQEYNSNLGQTQFGDKMGIAAGKQHGDLAAEDYWGKKYGEDQKASGGMLGGLMGVVGSLGGAALAAASGGRVPGMPRVAGDSLRNDTVPVITSPGEVIVPRSVVASSPSHIASFVKNPPPIAGATGNKEAMLSALKRIGNRR